MFAEKIIIEYLNADGSMQTSIIEDERGENILVDYALRKKGKSEWSAPFLILSDDQDRIRRKLIPKTRLSPKDFISIAPNEFAFRQEWMNIRFKDPYSLGLYALGFPEYAHLLSLEVNDPYRPGKQFRRNVIKDNECLRYFVLMELSSSRFSFSFEIRSRFIIDKRAFLSENFSDSEYQMFGDAISNSGFREFAEVIPDVPVIHYDNRQYDFSESTISQVSTGDHSPIQNFHSIIAVADFQHPHGDDLKSAIEEFQSRIESDPKIDSYYKEKTAELLTKITKELSKPPEGQDKGFIKHYWGKTVSLCKDLGAITGLISTISKLFGF